MRHHVACATWGHPDLAWVGERAVGLLRVGKRTYDPAMSRSMVGSVGTRQPAASRSQACRRACPAHDAGVHLPAVTPRRGLEGSEVRERTP